MPYMVAGTGPDDWPGSSRGWPSGNAAGFDVVTLLVGGRLVLWP